MIFNEINMFDDTTNKVVPVGSIGYFGDTPSKIMYLVEKEAKPSVLKGVLEQGTLKRYVTDAYLPDSHLFNREYIPDKEAYRYFYFVDFKKKEYNKIKVNNGYFKFQMSGIVSEYKGDSFILNCNGNCFPFIFLQGLPSVSTNEIIEAFPLIDGQNITVSFAPVCDRQDRVLILEVLSIIAMNE